ncbi:MAG: hypothetical protein ACFFG0_45555 [Candidatus Thorarchaeota archaeon]
MKAKIRKIITHDLVNVFNDCEPMDKGWINKVNGVLDLIRQEECKDISRNIGIRIQIIKERTCYTEIEKILRDSSIHLLNQFKEDIDQRHLSTFQKKRDIIADKQKSAKTDNK